MCIYTLDDEDPRPESLLDGDFSLETTENEYRDIEEDLR